MCGIAGITKFKEGIGPGDVAVMEKMTAAQRHRGPDDSGMYNDAHAAIGHRRLSIIDISAAGRQPMANETGTVWVVYNGEIYNYRELGRELAIAGHEFSSQSDTEVLLHGYEEWGEDGLLRRLRGMFAFALYDKSRRRLILARDRLGIKPLYYSVNEETGRLGFASEVKALSGMVALETDRQALAGFLLLGSVPSPLTISSGVRCLPPGELLIADAGGVRTRRYWDLVFTEPPAPDADASGRSIIVAALKEALRDSVARHLVSDVPVGIFLSGGVDSAGLVALARPVQERLKTVTIAFDEAEFDEADQARAIAERFETEHHELRVGGADFVRELPRILAAMDQPSNDGVNSYFVAKAAREAGLTVVLSGTGGDELFWGYRHYHLMQRNRSALELLTGMPAGVRKACIAGAVAYGRLRGREPFMRLAGLGPAVSPESLYVAFRGFFPSQQARELLGAGESEMDSLVEDSFARLAPLANGTHANGVNYIEMKRYLHDQLLRDTDAFSMAHSVEVRVPYLDDEVVALASRIPAIWKTNGAVNKPLLVDAIGDPLVARASRRVKRGFSFPLGKWMKERTGLMREVAMRTDLLDRKTVGSMWSAFEKGRLHWSRAWSLVVLGARG